MKAVAVQAPDRGLKIGLCWAGNPDYAHDAERSMPLQCLAPLLEIPERVSTRSRLATAKTTLRGSGSTA
jgi:hypothetical protein